MATSQTLASQAGAQILARGGSAIDAAIAANATLGVVEPMMNGVGGDLFAIYWDAKTGKLTGINASGWAPAALTLAKLRDKGYRSMPEEGIHSVTVPGCVAGWDKLHKKFGRLSWSEIFRPAIYYAEQGFPVTEIIQNNWHAWTSKIASEDGGAKVFLRDSRAPEVGEVFRNPDLAKALRAIATSGPSAFYSGVIAKAILKTSDRLGGTFAAADLSEFEPEWVEPISTEYRGWKIYELPPNGQGIAALEMLNIMETFPLFQWKPRSSEALHAKIEAQKLAYADLIKYVADPKFSKAPVAGMLSKKYASERAQSIQPASARCESVAGTPPSTSGDTIYLSVVDREGNIVSLIQSLYLSFGSGVMVEGMGFHLQNRGALFVMDEKHPNVIAPRKRPFHTIIPGFMEKDNIHIGFGIMGGFNQAQAHAQFVSNLVDHNMNIQGALEAPRFTKMTFGGCDLMIEGRVPEPVRDELTAKGHKLEVVGDYSAFMGGGQAVIHDSSAKVNYGASSPRKDGAAIPEPPRYFDPPAAPKGPVSSSKK